VTHKDQKEIIGKIGKTSVGQVVARVHFDVTLNISDIVFLERLFAGGGQLKSHQK